MSRLDGLNESIWKSYHDSRRLHDKLRQNGGNLNGDQELEVDDTINNNVEMEDAVEGVEEDTGDREENVIIRVSSNDIPNLQRLIAESNFSKDLQAELKMLLMKTYWEGFYSGYDNGANNAFAPQDIEEEAADDDDNHNEDV